MNMEILLTYCMLTLNLIINIYSYRILTNEKIMVKMKKVLLLLIFAMVILIINLINIITLKIFATIFIILLLIKLFYNASLKRSLYYTIIISIISMLSDMIVSMLIVNNKYLINFYLFKSESYFRCLLTIPVCFITFCFCNIKCIKKVVAEFYSKIFKSRKNENIIILYLIFIAILTTLLSCLNAYNHVNRFGHFILFLGVIGLLLLSCITLYLIYKEHQISILNKNIIEENIDNLNLAVDNKIKKDLIDMLSPKNYNHFCTSVGILFDNALDAVKSCKEKFIEINFLENDEYVYYIQKNSFNNVVDLEQTGTKEYTTKKNGHGIGLNYVKNLKNIETKNTVINNMFITKVKVKKIKM